MGTSSDSRLTPHHHWPWKRTLQILVQCAGGDNEDAHYQRYYKTMPSGLDFPCQAKSIWRRFVLLLLTEAVGWASVPEWCRRRCSGSYFDGVLLRMIFTPHLSSGLSSDLILDYHACHPEHFRRPFNIRFEKAILFVSETLRHSLYSVSGKSHLIS